MASEAAPPDPAAGSPPPTPATAPRRRRWARWTAALLLVALVFTTGLALLAWWGLRSEAGTAFVMRQLPNVRIEGAKGALLGDYSAERVTVTIPGSGARLVLVNARWRGLRTSRSPFSGAWLRLQIDELTADRAEWLAGTSPAASDPLKAPATLRLPIELQIGALQVGEVDAAALGDRPLRDVRAAIHLGAEAGALHRLDGLRLNWDRLAATGSLRIATAGDMAVAAQIALTPLRGDAAVAPAAAAASVPAGAPPTSERGTEPKPAAASSLDALLERLDWRAEATLAGPLAAPQLKVTLRTPASPAGARTGAARAAQSLDAEAALRPFEAWPLGDFRSELRALDLSTLHSAAPRTALSGTALATTRGLDRPADIRLTLANAAAGRWSDGLLPVRGLDLAASGRPDTPRVIELSRFEATLGSSAQQAGRIDGKGQLAPERWALDLVLAELQPAQLDSRAPDMRLSGSIRASGNLPPSTSASAPAGAAASTPARTTGSASAPASRAVVAARPAPVSIDAKAELSGTLAALPGRRGASPKVQLELDAGLRSGATPGAIEFDLRRVVAVAGESQATLGGSAKRTAAGAPWKLKGDATLAEFDPLAWWPGAPSSAWQQGRHRINATAGAALSWAPPHSGAVPRGQADRRASESTLGQRLAGIEGDASVALRPSLLAGVPLNGRLVLRSLGSGTLGAELALDAAGNRIALDGSLDTASIGAAAAARDRWNVVLDAPSLNRLTPLLGLLSPPGSVPRQIAGALVAKAEVDGRWPDVRTSGTLDATAVASGDLRIDKAAARWQLGTAPNAATELTASIGGARLGETSLESSRIVVAGTARSHRLELAAVTRALPPAWADALQASPPRAPAGAGVARGVVQATPRPAVDTRSEAILQLQGGLLEGSDPTAAGALGAIGWRGTLQRAELRSSATPGAPWLRIAEVGVEAAWSGGPPRATVQPGRAEIRLGNTAAALRWKRVAWQAASPPATGSASTPARLDAEAELEPLAVAPILGLLQPDFGWGGDLMVGGKLAVRSAPTFKADIVLERQRGDLQVSDESGTQRLGLTDLRLGLTADNGVWSFTQALAGTTLGVAAGAIVARTSTAATWPAPQTPVQGVVELDVANLGTWGTWVPSGWRLGGKLHVSAGIGGRVGGPELTGSLRGSGLTVRNFLEGVNVHDGEVAIDLQGSTARIEHFTAKAGDGSLSLAGSALLGDSPRAQLQLSASRFQLLGRVDRRIVTSGDAALRIDPKQLSFDGNFMVDEGLIDFSRGDAPTLSSDVVVLRTAEAEAARRSAIDPAAPPGAAAKTPVSDKPPRRNVALNVRVDLGEKLRLRGRGIDTGLAGELRITAPGGQPAFNGAVRTVGGTYNAYSQKLVIDRGTLTFNGPVGNPRLDILATRPNSDVRVGVSVTGLALGPRIRLYSEPDMSETDKLSWLVLGRASDSLGRTDTALLQRAALALVSGEGEGKGDQLTRTLGLDELSLRQRDTGDVKATVISLGKQLSTRWYVGYEQGLNSTVGGFQLIYRLARRFTLRAQTGRDNSLDLVWSLRSQGAAGTSPVSP